jgi:subtilase family serine protease
VLTLSSFLTIIRRVLFATCFASAWVISGNPTQAQTKVQPPYTPAEVQGAYGISGLVAAPLSKTPIVAVVDAYGDIDVKGHDHIYADLQSFCSTYGKLPYFPLSGSRWTLKEEWPLGKPTSPNTSWAIETAMDVEWVHAVAPYAHILLVVSPTNNPGDVFKCVQWATHCSSLGV